MTEAELHVGTCAMNSAGATVVALASCVAASHFTSQHAGFKAKRSFPVVFPCTETSTLVRDKLSLFF